MQRGITQIQLNYSVPVQMLLPNLGWAYHVLSYLSLVGLSYNV